MILRATGRTGTTLSGWDGYGCRVEAVEVDLRTARGVGERLCYGPEVRVVIDEQRGTARIED